MLDAGRYVHRGPWLKFGSDAVDHYLPPPLKDVVRFLHSGMGVELGVRPKWNHEETHRQLFRPVPLPMDGHLDLSWKVSRRSLKRWSLIMTGGVLRHWPDDNPFSVFSLSVFALSQMR